jgi:hypothetical protein
MENVDEEQLKVAKMVIVGWIKDWSCLTTYYAITGRRFYHFNEMQETCEKYPFLPSHWLWYATKTGKISNKPIRKYIADINKKLSDALWDTEDNMKKLEFAPYLAKLKSKDVKTSAKYSKEDIAEKRKTINEYVAKQHSYWGGKIENQKLNGTHWTTVK